MATASAAAAALLLFLSAVTLAGHGKLPELHLLTDINYSLLKLSFACKNTHVTLLFYSLLCGDAACYTDSLSHPVHMFTTTSLNKRDPPYQPLAAFVLYNMFAAVSLFAAVQPLLTASSQPNL
jgi:hypothetical protein